MNRKFALVSQVKKGTRVITDGGFTCLKPDQRRTVCEDSDGLYIRCREGKHYLSGQIDDSLAGEIFVGLYLAE